MYKVGKCLLRYRLIDARMSQTDLAVKLNMSKGRINDYINNRREMSLGTAKSIAAALRCNIDDLYEWIPVKE